MQHLVNFSAEILILLFLTITFLFSGLEKILNWKECLHFYSDHFKNTIIKNRLSVFLVIVIIGEIICGFLSVFGILKIVLFGDKLYGYYTTIFAAILLLAMLLGQRLAKDYAGAMNITVYLILTVFGVYLMQ